MKLNKIFPRVALVLAAIALAIPLALAQTQGGDGQGQGPRSVRKHGRGQRGDRHMDGRQFGRLNLTDAQKQQMTAIRTAFGDRTKEVREQLRTKNQELRQAQSGESFNEAVATQKLTEMAALRAKLMAEQHKLHQEMIAVLTPEQKAEFDQMKAKRGEMRARKFQGRAGNQ